MNLKQKFKNKMNVIGAWLSVGHPAVAEVTATQEFDFVLIDTEHTVISLETVENMSRGVDAVEGDTETIVRVPSNDAVRIKRILDIGVAGIMVPMIETAAEAREVVKATRYPPRGIRGVASGRATEYGNNFQEYVKTANDSIVTIVQIESQHGMDNVDDIAGVEGIDAIFVGPADLSANLGIFAEWENEQLNDTIQQAIAAGENADLPVGTLVIDPDDIEMRIKQGFDYLIVGKDTSHLASSNEAVRKRYESAISRIDTPATND